MIICNNCIEAFSNLPIQKTYCKSNKCIIVYYCKIQTSTVFFYDYYSYNKNILDKFTNDSRINKIRFLKPGLNSAPDKSGQVLDIYTDDMQSSLINFYKKIEYICLLD